MTEDEIRTVIRVTNTADSGCADCAWALASKLIKHFPDLTDAIKQEWAAEFEMPFDDPPEPEQGDVPATGVTVRFPRID